MIKLGGIITRNAWAPQINEASEDDKYTHIGYGHYKLKGKEKDPNAVVFSKDDSGKYIANTKDDAKSKSGGTETKPRVNIFDKPQTSAPAKSPTSQPEKPKPNVFDKPKASSATNTTAAPKEKGTVPSTKLTSIMPKADAKAFNGQSDIHKVSKETRRAVSMKIDELDKMAQKAQQMGKDAPDFNLCEITIPGTNLYCDDNLGIPREQMPQFKGKPLPGTPASKMPLDKWGGVDTEPMFQKMLAKKGIKIIHTEIPSDALKATQSELIGTKVAGITKAIEADPTNPKLTAPIYVSRDGYVIDGHHRWAAMTSKAIRDGKPANMKVMVIDDDAKNIIPMANKFAEDIGIAANKGTNASVEPKKTESIKMENTDRTKLVNILTEGMNPISQIAHLTGARPTAIQHFIQTFKLNAEKIAQYVKDGGLRSRMDFTSAIAGVPNNRFELMFKQKFANESILKEDRSLSQIAREISQDWKNVNYGAKPYLSAMHSLNKISDRYMYDSGTSVVAYFLANAGTWKGEKAKEIKAELNKMLKSAR